MIAAYLLWKDIIDQFLSTSTEEDNTIKDLLEATDRQGRSALWWGLCASGRDGKSQITKQWLKAELHELFDRCLSQRVGLDGLENYLPSRTPSPKPQHRLEQVASEQPSPTKRGKKGETTKTWSRRASSRPAGCLSGQWACFAQGSLCMHVCG